MRKLTIILLINLIITSFSYTQKYSTWMANSVMFRNPDKYGVKWDYVVGTVLRGFQELYIETKDMNYYNYIKNTIDYIVNDDGKISNYKKTAYNLDMIKEGSSLLFLYKTIGEQKYKIAADSLYKQLMEQPRTSEGGFWHKKVYPYQMWLDGLYMAEPFYAEYSVLFKQMENLDDVINQFYLMEKHALDTVTGLLYHGWDEQKVQIWANSVTGCSKSFWGRAIGWYMMGLIEVLDFLPENYLKQDTLINIFRHITEAIVKYQDENSGCWYQVIDQGSKAGNYLESSATSMFVYSLFKGIRKGYIESAYLVNAIKGYNGILNNFIVEENSYLKIINSCCTAGLSADRDGSYEYYVYQTSVCDNDGKAIGPFILASLEYEKLFSHGYNDMENNIKPYKIFSYLENIKICWNGDINNDINVYISDTSGKIFLKTKMNSSENIIHINQKGIYLICIINQKKSFIDKIIIN